MSSCDYKSHKSRSTLTLLSGKKGLLCTFRWRSYILQGVIISYLRLHFAFKIHSFFNFIFESLKWISSSIKKKKFFIYPYQVFFLLNSVNIILFMRISRRCSRDYYRKVTMLGFISLKRGIKIEWKNARFYLWKGIFLHIFAYFEDYPDLLGSRGFIIFFFFFMTSQEKSEKKRKEIDILERFFFTPMLTIRRLYYFLFHRFFFFFFFWC